MPDVSILCDEDCDGLMSAQLITKGLAPLSTSLHFQKWNKFGASPEDIDSLIAEKPKRIFILDLGSGREMIDHAATILSQGIGVTILDNHPPDPAVDPEEVTYVNNALDNLRSAYPKDFFYDSSNESCTTGIIYEHFWSPIETANVEVVVNAQRWALIGLTGDVATDPIESPRGNALYTHLLDQYPYLGGLFMSKADGALYDFGLLSFYAKLFHVPRRMLFDESPLLCMKAMEEMEKIPNWIEFNRLLGTKDEIETTPLFKDGKNPATKLLLKVQQEWEKEHGKADDKGKSTILRFPQFDVTILSHKWNLGSSLASKRAGMTKKTQFVVNDIPGKEIHITGRGGRDGGIHIGKVFKSCESKVLVGGGLRPAGSAKGMTNNIEAIVNEIVRNAK